jgi:hypothetical protein
MMLALDKVYLIFLKIWVSIPISETKQFILQSG